MTPHPMTSHHMISHPMTPHHVTCHLISHPMTPHHIKSTPPHHITCGLRCHLPWIWLPHPLPPVERGRVGHCVPVLPAAPRDGSVRWRCLDCEHCISMLTNTTHTSQNNTDRSSQSSTARKQHNTDSQPIHGRTRQYQCSSGRSP